MKLTYSIKASDLDAFLRKGQETAYVPALYLGTGMALLIAIPWVVFWQLGIHHLLPPGFLISGFLGCSAYTAFLSWFFLAKRSVIERYWATNGYLKLQDPDEVTDTVTLEIQDKGIKIGSKTGHHFVRFEFVCQPEITLDFAYIKADQSMIIIPQDSVLSGDYEKFLDALLRRSRNDSAPDSIS